MPSVTTREYNPSTGALIGNVSSLNFGKIIVGSHSPARVFDFAFTGVSAVSNVKLGITSSTLEVNPAPESIQEDGSASNGRYGIRHTESFDVDVASGILGRHFPGKNTSGLATDENNVEIGTRNATTSQFAYLDVELGGDDAGMASGVYRLFFDFE